MKKLIFISLLLVGVAFAQRPSSVDNSAFFPPAATQIHANCSSFSLIYYLKSSIWNQKYNRDPRLPENQFSADFIWNQVVSPSDHFAGNDQAVEIMSKQGCATVANFPLQTDVDILPSLQTRESGLMYRSSKLNVISLYGQDSVGITNTLNQLKDSLSQGICFTIHIPFFGTLLEVNKDNLYYRYDSSMSQATMSGSHYVVVTGYDDNKKAFIALDSKGTSFGDNGYFLIGYEWFYGATWWGWTYSFLEENFSHLPLMSVVLYVGDMVTGEDWFFRKNIFVDQVFSTRWGTRFDYNPSDYFGYSGLIKIRKVNGQIVPASVDQDGYHNNNNLVLLPKHNHDGNRQVLVDLTDYKANDFKSLELLVVDPISASYVRDDNSIIYSYTREPKAKINEAYIKILGTNKRIVGKVVDLPDTTIVSHDFDSYPAAFHLSPPSGDPVHIKVCTSVLKRKLITFRIEDISTINNPPVYTNIPRDTLKAEAGSVIEYKFEAADPDGDQLRYSLAQPEVGATIDSATGLFKFHSDQPVKKHLKVVVTDGYNNVIGEFALEMFTTVGVEDELGIPKEYSLSQNYPNPFNPATVINFSLPRSGHVTLKVYNLLGQEVAVLINGELNAGAHNTKFDASNLASGIYIYRLDAKGFSQAKKMIFTK